jgi:hypothetical protein
MAELTAVNDLRMTAVEGAMRVVSRKVTIGFLCLVFSPLAVSSYAQQPADAVKVVQVMGFADVKANAKGNLKLENGNLQFSDSKAKSEVSITSVDDVITGNDSQRVFHGTFGTMTLLAPYGGGRFLSLFRSKLDTLSIQYRDAGGGLHGAIFTMPVGKADPFKKLLVAQGARTSVPIQDDSNNTAPKAGAAKEQKP